MSVLFGFQGNECRTISGPLIQKETCNIKLRSTNHIFQINDKVVSTIIFEVIEC